MQLSATDHTSRPWRIHEIAPDFGVEDVWRLPWRGEADDFPGVVEFLARGTPAHSSSAVVRGLFALRQRLGAVLGWDGASPGPRLRDRLPDDLRDTPVPRFEALAFEPLYLLEDEFAAELANRTMHGVLHVGRVPHPEGGCGAQMAVLVKPGGALGGAYMAAIRPFRRLIVYPALLREWERKMR